MTNLIQKIKNDIKIWYKGVLAAIAYCIAADLLWGKMCPMILLTGLPCPGCGLTRAGISLITLHWSEAWTMNACIFLIVPAIIYYLVCHYFFDDKCKGGIVILCAIIVCLLVYYFYRMIYIYPGQAPMQYHTPNFIQYLRQTSSFFK